MKVEEENRRRVVIEHVTPEIDDGRYPIKRVVGDTVTVEADVFTDGHEAVSCVLLYRKASDADWTEVPLTPLVNDRWAGEFTVAEMGEYRYTIQGWLDHFKLWSRNLVKRMDAGQDVSVDLLIGANLVDEGPEAAPQAMHADQLNRTLLSCVQGGYDAAQWPLSPELADLMYRCSTA